MVLDTVPFIAIVVILLLTLFALRKFRQDRKLNKITFHNWWEESSQATHSKVRSYFGAMLEDIIDNYKEVRIYSVFGSEDTLPRANEKIPGVLTIHYSGEASLKDPDLFDLSIVPSEEEETTLGIPHMLLQTWCNNTDLSSLTKRRRLGRMKDKFCLFAVSNGKSEKRNQFFGELSNYKRVDSCGSFKNNLGYKCPGRHDSPEYCEFIGQYKFMICFENTSMSNYLTEKLLNSYTCGTIPIYWGCPNLGDYVDLNSVLYLKPDFTQYDLEKLIIEIKKLDNDDALYKAKYESIFFKEGKIPENFQLPVIKNKIKTILDQPIKMN